MPYRLGPNQKGKLTAIIDIGSNTVRLVVFHGPSRTPLPIFNEKVQCRLGKELDKTGLLYDVGVERAYHTIGRFMKLIDVMDVDQVKLVATAAVREAQDGPEFVAEIDRRFNAKVDVISGEEEAKLAAYGLLSGLPHADGLLGDMGGASFDLVGLDHGRFSTHETTPLGHLRIMSSSETDIKTMRSHIRTKLAPIDWARSMKDRPFYAVGGSLRAVARLIMHHVDYPLHVIDNFTLAQDKAIAILDILSRLDLEDMLKVPDVSKKRLETLPAAIALLQEILEIIQPSFLVFSGYSMREGQFFMGLDEELKQQDPLISACKGFVAREGRFGQQGEEVYDWMAPLFPDETDELNRLRHAACLLHDISWTEHPDYRGDHGLLRVLRFPVAGLSHHDRALLAACVYSRYKGDFSADIAKPLRSFLNEEDERWTKKVGAALRLAHTLASGAPHLLEETNFEKHDETLILHLPEGNDIFSGEAIEKRLQTLAKLDSLQSEIIHG
jgi:exopolyphosphatase/guanosine-5'-triphosphate,3'-diphosphate pyrophosphatase